MPFGIKPPLLYKLDTPLTSEANGQTPNTAVTPIIINTIIATTLIKANQNSNSPKLLVLIKLAKLSKIIKEKAYTALEIPGNHACKISAPAIASIGITNTQNHQYNHPMVNPAHGPIALRA